MRWMATLGREHCDKYYNLHTLMSTQDEKAIAARFVRILDNNAKSRHRDLEVYSTTGIQRSRDITGNHYRP